MEWESFFFSWMLYNHASAFFFVTTPCLSISWQAVYALRLSALLEVAYHITALLYIHWIFYIIINTRKGSLMWENSWCLEELLCLCTRDGRAGSLWRSNRLLEALLVCTHSHKSSRYRGTRNMVRGTWIDDFKFPVRKGVYFFRMYGSKHGTWSSYFQYDHMGRSSFIRQP
jgi:hypothetical protein